MESRISQVSQPNQGAIADIGFLLLIFFMVATSIVEDQGILVELPQWDAPIIEAGSENVLSIMVNADNNYMVEGEIIELSGIEAAVMDFVMNPGANPHLPSDPRKAVISLQTDRGTRYEAYIAVYDAIRSSYSKMRDVRSRELFGAPFDLITVGQQKRIRHEIPVVLSEAEPTSYGELKD